MTEQELNEAVAWKLGWTVHTSGSNTWTNGTAIRQLPDYCRSLAAAWEIFEFLKAKKYLVDIFNPDQRWMVRIWPEEKGTTILTSSAEDTAPLAICRAFLKVP